MNSNISSRPPRSKGLAHVALRMLNLEAPLPRAGAEVPAHALPEPVAPASRRVADPLLPLADAAAAMRRHRPRADVGHAEGRRAEGSDLESDPAEMGAMLKAVIARLRLTVDERFLPSHDERSREHAHRIRASVLECVAALEHLDQGLGQTSGSRRPARGAALPPPRR